MTGFRFWGHPVSDENTLLRPQGCQRNNCGRVSAMESGSSGDAENFAIFALQPGSGPLRQCASLQPRWEFVCADFMICDADKLDLLQRVEVWAGNTTTTHMFLELGGESFMCVEVWAGNNAKPRILFDPGCLWFATRTSLTLYVLQFWLRGHHDKAPHGFRRLSEFGSYFLALLKDSVQDQRIYPKP